MGVRVKVGFQDSVEVQNGQNFPSGAFGAHELLRAAPFANNCWPEASEVSGVWCLSAWNRFHRTHRIRLPRPGWAGRRHTAAGEASIASLSSPPRSPPPPRPPVPRCHRPDATRRGPEGGVGCLPPAHALHSAGTLAGLGRGSASTTCTAQHPGVLWSCRVASRGSLRTQGRHQAGRAV